MIEIIDLPKLRNGELSQFLQDVLIITVAHEPDEMKLKDSFNVLQKQSAALEAAFKMPAGRLITREIELLDEERDNTFKGIQAIVRGNVFSADASISAHAQALDTHLGLYADDIAYGSYLGETNSIRNIVEDWKDQPRLKQAVAALGLQDWQKRLETANNSFSEKYVTRAAELGADSSESLSTVRNRVYQAYYGLRDEINAYYTITRAAEPYKSVVASINGLIAFYNDLMARRRGMGEAGGKALIG